VSFFLTRRQSFILGLGLLGTFFLMSGSIIYSRNKSRIPASSLSRETIEGFMSTPVPQQNTPRPEETQAGVGAGFVLNEFHRNLVKDGKVVWEIFGKRGRYAPGSNVAAIEEPLLKFYDPKNGEIQVSAKHADLSITISELSRAVLSEKVVITAKGGTTIKTNRAIYDRTKNTVESPGPFELDHPAFRLVGSTCTTRVDAQEIVVSGGVQTTLKPKAGRKH
jgi:LPS export ABC transporter protein LptC